MSVHIPLSSLDNADRDAIETDLCIDVVHPKTKKKRAVELVSSTTDRNGVHTVCVPFFYGRERFFDKRVLGGQPFTHTYSFNGKLRPEQRTYRNNVVKTLNEQNVCILATHVAFGKSILAINVAYNIKLKTLIIVNRLALMHQWQESLERFVTQPRVQVLTSKSILDPDTDFFIVNLINLPKLKDLDAIGFVIMDEVHLLVSDKLVQGLFSVSPTYLLGLSATPYRSDGLNAVLDLFFSQKCWYKKLWREHRVVVVPTGFKPEMRKMYGKVDWNFILCQQSENEARNRLILALLVEKDHNFLVLSKRVEQIQWFERELTALGVSNECLYDDRQPSDRECKVLVGTIQKIGTGFDKPHLNALVVAGDVEEYFIQYLGRVFRRPEVVPTIYDFKDNNSLLQKHLKTRCDVYREHGGVLDSR